jgi:hypothetical protein
MTPFPAARQSDTWLAAAVAASLIISLTPWAPWLLYPFKLFTTWVHECGHAAAAVLVGGRVTSITIHADTSGLTESLVPAGRVARGFVASAGYLGAALVGCLLLAATRAERWAHVILLGLGVCLLLTLVFWIRNLFGALVILIWSVTLIALARQGLGPGVRVLLSLLAIQVALNAVYDIRALFLLGHAPSDARTMQGLFLLPSWIWATLWMAISVAMLGGTFWVTRAAR